MHGTLHLVKHEQTHMVSFPWSNKNRHTLYPPLGQTMTDTQGNLLFIKQEQTHCTLPLIKHEQTHMEIFPWIKQTADRLTAVVHSWLDPQVPFCFP